MTDDLREQLGRQVREVWVAWARNQPAPKASWLLPWDELTEPDREVDRQIGEALYARGVAAKDFTIAELRDMVDRRDDELAAIDHILRSLPEPEGNEAVMSLSNRVRLAFKVITAQLAELTRERRALWDLLKRLARTQRGEVGSLPVVRCPKCRGDAGSNWFDREICPEPCGAMHTRCKGCGYALDGCPLTDTAGLTAQEAKQHACHDACPCEGNPTYRRHLEHPGVDHDCPWCPDPAEATQEDGEPPAPRVWTEFRAGDRATGTDLDGRTVTGVVQSFFAWDHNLGRNSRARMLVDDGTLTVVSAPSLTEVLEVANEDGDTR